MELIRCPNCGKSYYQYHYSVTTAMGWTPIFKDGIEQNCDPNISTSYCTCCECGHNFYYEEQHGKIIKVVDQGKKPEVPTLEVPINANEGEQLTVTANDILFKQPESTSVTFNGWKTFATSEDIDKLNEKIERLTKMVESLWKWNTDGVYNEIEK